MMNEQAMKYAEHGVVSWCEYDCLKRECDMWRENFDRVSEHLKSMAADRERLRPLLRAICEMSRDYSDYWWDLDQHGKAYCLPSSLHGAFERLRDLIGDSGLTMADISDRPI